MMAWLRSPGAWCEGRSPIKFDANTQKRFLAAVVRTLSSTRNNRENTLSTLPSTIGSGRPKAIDITAPQVYRPTPFKAPKRSGSEGSLHQTLRQSEYKHGADFVHENNSQAQPRHRAGLQEAPSRRGLGLETAHKTRKILMNRLTRVCCNMISDTQTCQGVGSDRHAISRAFSANHDRSAVRMDVSIMDRLPSPQHHKSHRYGL